MSFRFFLFFNRISLIRIYSNIINWSKFVQFFCIKSKNHFLCDYWLFFFPKFLPTKIHFHFIHHMLLAICWNIMKICAWKVEHNPPGMGEKCWNKLLQQNRKKNTSRRKITMHSFHSYQSRSLFRKSHENRFFFQLVQHISWKFQICFRNLNACYILCTCVHMKRSCIILI